MLEALFENSIKERILLSILTQKEVYARDIASKFGLHLQSVQDQFKKLELGGVVVSKLRGRTRLYTFNPRYPFLKELCNLLNKAFLFIDKKEKDKFYVPRLRPRRTSKPL